MGDELTREKLIGELLELSQMSLDIWNNANSEALQKKAMSAAIKALGLTMRLMTAEERNNWVATLPEPLKAQTIDVLSTSGLS